MLTGALTIISPGSPEQLVVGLLIVLMDCLLVLKIAPFRDDSDDYLSFVTSFQMLITLLGGLLIKTDDPSARHFEVVSMGTLLVALNSAGFVVLVFSLAAMHPAVREKLNHCARKLESDNGTKVVPEEAPKKKGAAAAPMTMTEAEIAKEGRRLRQWQDE